MLLRKLYYLNQVKNRVTLPKDKLDEFKLTALKDLLKHAYTTVPFYNRIYKKHKIDVFKLKTFDDFKRLPIIKKEHLRENYNDFISNEYIKLINQGNFNYNSTSGSTGPQIKIMFDKRSNDYLDAIYFRTLILLGYNPKKSLSYYWYKPFKKNILSLLGFMKKDYINQKLTFNEQIDLLNTLNPKYLIYFPVILYNLIKRYPKKIKFSPKLIFTQGEILSSKMKQRIEKTLKTTIYDLYGSSEFNIIAYKCQKECGYHINEDSVHLEILKNNSIIITGLTNYLMPLIRYDIGDKATKIIESCSCGTHFRKIEEILGKNENMIKSNNNTISSKIIIDLLDEWDIGTYRILQKQKDSLIIITEIEINKTLKHKIITCFKKVNINKIYFKIEKINLSSRGKIEICKNII